jgi:hypothetical protein
LISIQGVGAIFVGIFLAAYLGGMLMNPSTTVLHSEPVFRIPLIITGTALFILLFAAAILAIYSKNRMKT